MLKYLITTLTAIFILIPSIAQAQSGPKRYLYAIDRDGDEAFIGVMISEDVCKEVAGALNVWAQLPPVTPQTFVCRSAS
jgi:hypothetical protein